MKYTTELTNKIQRLYKEGISIADIAKEIEAPERSVIAKLSSLGIYKKKEYLNKRGERPTSKQSLIYDIANKLDISVELLDSLEKATKSALVLILSKL